LRKRLTMPAASRTTFWFIPAPPHRTGSFSACLIFR
jgi:hypothetical protein